MFQNQISNRYGYLTVGELVFLDEENLDGKNLDYQHLDHTLI